MGDNREFNNPPVVEAVFSVGVAKLTVADGAIADFCKRIGYPQCEPYFEQRLKVSVAGELEELDLEITGLRCATDEGNEVAKVRTTGLSYSRLSPYPGWEPFAAEGFRLWELYVQNFGWPTLDRVSIRFINRVDLARREDSLRLAFKLFPTLPPAFEHCHDGYLAQFKFRDEESSFETNLIQALVDPPSPEVISVVLDIDVFSTEDLPSDLAGLKSRMDALRSFKNRVFLACITDELARSFE